MKTSEFEKKIQKEISEDLSIRVNPNHSDIAGVYYKDTFISVSIAPEEIKEEFDPNYKDAVGNAYRTIEQSYELIKHKYARYSSPEAQELIREMDNG